jgi:hypothetical protein
VALLMGAQPLSNRPRNSPETNRVHQPDEFPIAELAAEHRVSLRGLLVAIALAAPFWIVLYLLLRH